MASQLITAEVLRRMVHERLEALHRGEITPEFAAGYVVASFHAGAISFDECTGFLRDNNHAFQLSPPDVD